MTFARFLGVGDGTALADYLDLTDASKYVAEDVDWGDAMVAGGAGRFRGAYDQSYAKTIDTVGGLADSIDALNQTIIETQAPAMNTPGPTVNPDGSLNYSQVRTEAEWQQLKAQLYQGNSGGGTPGPGERGYTVPGQPNWGDEDPRWPDFWRAHPDLWKQTYRGSHSPYATYDEAHGGGGGPIIFEMNGREWGRLTGWEIMRGKSMRRKLSPC